VCSLDPLSSPMNRERPLTLSRGRLTESVLVTHATCRTQEHRPRGHEYTENIKDLSGSPEYTNGSSSSLIQEHSKQAPNMRSEYLAAARLVQAGERGPTCQEEGLKEGTGGTHPSLRRVLESNARGELQITGAPKILMRRGSCTPFNRTRTAQYACGM